MDSVRDIMNTNVVTVGPDTSVHDLTRLLAEYQVSGAPVLGNEGEVLGVVSMTDVMRLADDGPVLRKGGRPLDRGSATPMPDDDETDLLDYFQHGYRSPSGGDALADWVDENDLDQYQVREIMTPANFHIHPDASLADLALFLLRGGIHRALVMEGEVLAGVVTTVDVLRTVEEGISA